MEYVDKKCIYLSVVPLSNGKGKGGWGGGDSVVLYCDHTITVLHSLLYCCHPAVLLYCHHPAVLLSRCCPVLQVRWCAQRMAASRASWGARWSLSRCSRGERCHPWP